MERVCHDFFAFFFAGSSSPRGIYYRMSPLIWARFSVKAARKSCAQITELQCRLSSDFLARLLFFASSHFSKNARNDFPLSVGLDIFHAEISLYWSNTLRLIDWLIDWAIDWLIDLMTVWKPKRYRILDEIMSLFSLRNWWYNSVFLLAKCKLLFNLMEKKPR